jgi:hypothetical protein
VDRRQEVTKQTAAGREQQAAEDEEANACEQTALGKLAETWDEDRENECFHGASPGEPLHAGCLGMRGDAAGHVATTCKT